MLRQIHIAIRANHVEVTTVTDSRTRTSTDKLTPSQAAKRLRDLAGVVEEASRECARELAGGLASD